MPVDSRDQIWDATFEVYYQSYFQEMLSDTLVTTWQRVDDITKLIVAIFAGTSAIAGAVSYYATSLNIHWVWPVFTGIAALVALFHKELTVPIRLRDHIESKRSFSALRLDLETFRSLMKFNPDFPIDEFSNKFVEFRKRYSEEYRRLKVDAFLTTKRREQCQQSLDELLAPILLKTGG